MWCGYGYGVWVWVRVYFGLWSLQVTPADEYPLVDTSCDGPDEDQK